MNSMTHYMELLATNQPWNLLIFMAVPVILAETLAITELVILFTRDQSGLTRKVNKIAGIAAGIYFAGIFTYLFQHAVVPLTLSGGWRGPFDAIAVGFYLSGLIPFAGIALLELGMIARGANEDSRLKIHASLVGVFLIVAHIAMIFGMLDPSLTVANHATMLM